MYLQEMRQLSHPTWSQPQQTSYSLKPMARSWSLSHLQQV